MASPEKEYVPPPPSMEYTSGGWYRVVGHEHGPCDRYGLENAQATLDAIIAHVEEKKKAALAKKS